VAIEANVQYRIRNRSGLVVDVPGSVLVEMVLAREPIEVLGEGVADAPIDEVDRDAEGQSAEELLRERVAPDRADSIREAHRQSNVNPIIDDPRADRERVAELRKHEADDAILRATAAVDDGEPGSLRRAEADRENPALQPLLGSGQDVTSDVTRAEQERKDPDSTWSTGERPDSEEV
jgi:hypothetical protein